MKFLTYQKLLNHLARKFSFNKDQYDELKSEFYLLFVETKDKYDENKGSFSNYLYFICKNHVINKIIKNNRDIKIDFEYPVIKEKEILFEIIIKKYDWGSRLWNEIKKGTFFNLKLLTNKYICEPTIYRMKKILRNTLNWNFYETEHAFHELRNAWRQIYG